MTPGFKEALKAVLAAVALGAVVTLVLSFVTGCASLGEKRAFLKYEHHSSIPDLEDRNTSDMVGFCVDVVLGPGESPYRPSMEGCVNKEINGSPTFGRDPSGELNIKVPLKVWK